MGRLGALIRKEFLQFFRRRPLIVLVIWTIAVEIAICAYSITYDVTHVRLAVADLDGSPASRELVARFSQTEYLDLAYRTRSPREIDDLLESGRATLALVVPPDFSRQLDQGLPASVQLLLDGSNSNTALVALGYARRIVGGYGRELEVARIRMVLGDPGPVPGVRNERRAWYNPALRSRPLAPAPKGDRPGGRRPRSGPMTNSVLSALARLPRTGVRKRCREGRS